MGSFTGRKNHLRYPLEPTKTPYTLKFTLQMILYGILSCVQSVCTPAPRPPAPEYTFQCEPLISLGHTVLTHHSHSNASPWIFLEGVEDPYTLPPGSLRFVKPPLFHNFLGAEMIFFTLRVCGTF